MTSIGELINHPDLLASLTHGMSHQTKICIVCFARCGPQKTIRLCNKGYVACVCDECKIEFTREVCGDYWTVMQYIKRENKEPCKCCGDSLAAKLFLPVLYKYIKPGGATKLYPYLECWDLCANCAVRAFEEVKKENGSYIRFTGSRLSLLTHLQSLPRCKSEIELFIHHSRPKYIELSKVFLPEIVGHIIGLSVEQFTFKK